MTIEQMTVETLYDALRGQRAVLIDVREPHEYEEAYIGGAALIPMGRCHAPSLPSNPDKMIVFQCKAGGRSQRVCELYAAANPGRTVYNLSGGILAWIAAGYPVESLKEETA